MWGCWSGRYLSVDVLGAQIMFETRQNICVHYKTTSIYIIKVNTRKYIQVNSKKRKFQLLLPFPSLHLAFKEIDRVKRRKLSHFKIPQVQRVPTRFGQPFLCHPFFQFCLSKIENGIPSKLLTYSTRPPPLTKKKQQFPITSKKWEKKIMNHLHFASNGLPPIFPTLCFSTSQWHRLKLQISKTQTAKLQGISTSSLLPRGFVSWRKISPWCEILEPKGD